MSSTPGPPRRWPAEAVSTEELARLQGVQPITSIDELVQPDLWESEQEYEDFLADLYVARRSSIS